jgi:hypothetical protein
VHDSSANVPGFYTIVQHAVPHVVPALQRPLSLSCGTALAFWVIQVGVAGVAVTLLERHGVISAGARDALIRDLVEPIMGGDAVVGTLAVSV